MKKPEYLIFSIVGIIVILLSSCSLDVKDDTRYITGEGPIISHYIETDTFRHIIHASIGSMNIQVGDTFTIELRAQQNIINEMAFLYEDDFFAWGMEKDVQITDSDSIIMNITIPVPLDYFKLGGIGNVLLSGPKQDKLDVELQGYGHVIAYDLEVDEADVYLAGSGNIKVRVNNSLTGLLSGNGNIYYKGDPEIDLPVMGNGKIINENQ